MSDSAKILLLDIETAPNVSYTWDKYDQNVIEFLEHWYILSFSVKWLHEKRAHTFILPDFPAWQKNKKDDRDLVQKIWDYLDEADIVVAHNGDRFDLPRINARLVAHKMHPPDEYQTVDTLKLARTYFKFSSNKLDDLAKYLKIGRKVSHTGPKLWIDCMGGCLKSWKRMRKYNTHDVALLEEVYTKLRPWARRHPNLSYFNRQIYNCPVCESPNTKRTGYAYSRCSKKQRRTCNDCGHRFRVGGPIQLNQL